MSKRTLDAFFKPPPKRTKESHPPSSDSDSTNVLPPDTHTTYPIPIAKLPPQLTTALKENTPSREPKIMNSQPDLDCLYYQPFIPRSTANELFRVLRSELPFYRVVYFAKRGGVDVEIKTPRFTTVFGVDEGCFFESEGLDSVVSKPGNGSGSGSDSGSAPAPAGEDVRNETETTNTEKPQQPSTKQDTTADITATPETSEYKVSTLTLHRKPNTPNIAKNHKYSHQPRPIPTCLHDLKTLVESTTKETYNFVLVNYYASGEDSIAFHSDDERFLGHYPTIASLSLGSEREFLLKHKPPPPPAPSNGTGSATGGGGGDKSASASATAASPTIKLPLSSGDMIVMKGPTQSNWLHSIPKRKGKSGNSLGGRINITFRKARIPAGTDNYYHYNVGTGPVWRWDDIAKEMKVQK